MLMGIFTDQDTEEVPFSYREHLAFQPIVLLLWLATL